MTFLLGSSRHFSFRCVFNDTGPDPVFCLSEETHASTGTDEFSV